MLKTKMLGVMNGQMYSHAAMLLEIHEGGFQDMFLKGTCTPLAPLTTGNSWNILCILGGRMWIAIVRN